MTARICVWPNALKCALIFMIDDLANIYFNRHGGDWGGKMFDVDGLYSYLERRLFSKTPDLKCTFFLVSGKRCVQGHGTYDYVAECISGGFPSFLTELLNCGHEIAYHGYAHGKLDGERFVQEWDTFSSVEEANAVCAKGLSLIHQAIGRYPSGGKYCGYKPGRYGHDSLLANGFSWWFDTWDFDVSKRPFGQWRDSVLYLPSNIDCSNYSLNMFGKSPWKKFLSARIRSNFFEGDLKKVRQLYDLGGIISLQEHTSPIRTDGIRQFPNLIDDAAFIEAILEEIDTSAVWFATASEVYNYSYLRDRSSLIVDEESLTIKFEGSLSEEMLADEKCYLSIEIVGKTEPVFLFLSNQPPLTGKLNAQGNRIFNIHAKDLNKRLVFAKVREN